MIRTRFAPSPTGFLHIGGARTALFAWAYARRHAGQFVLRIEDTDVARSTQEAVQGILDGMHWLGLDYDEGPFYQMQRMPRYKEVIQKMLAEGTAYPCYMSQAELDELREAQRARGEKPRYDGRWRPAPDKVLPTPPAGVLPVIRFKNPETGVVAWNDMVKGAIEFANTELDDLVIARQDGTPTYNFCVVVDDWDMQITHVIRGDDHVNNTPRQINILKALGAQPPEYAHLSMILGDDGTKLSKRHGAVSVMQYEEQGFLPEAIINYLARLGWSHGDDEIFSRAQLVEWFDLDHMTPSAAQFSTEKLLWLNQHYLKHTPPETLVPLVAKRLQVQGITTDTTDKQPDLTQAISLYVERCNTLNALAEALQVIYAPTSPSPELLAEHVTPEVIPALSHFATELNKISWEVASIAALLKDTLKQFGLKMPKLAMPLRIALTGQTQTPSVDAVIALLGRELTLSRLTPFLDQKVLNS